MNTQYQNHPELDPTSRLAGERMFHIGASTDTIADIYSRELALKNNIDDIAAHTAASISDFSDLNDRINRGEV
jgi:hypothetical protein